MASETYDPWEDFPELVPDLPIDNLPTDALPGTMEKEQVMAARAARRRSIFHPDDARLPDTVGFTPLPLPGCGDSQRGSLVQCAGGDWEPVPGQIPRPVPTLATDGPGLAARRARAREKAKDPVYRARMAMIKRAHRAFKRRQRAREADCCTLRMTPRRKTGLEHLTVSGMEAGDLR